MLKKCNYLIRKNIRILFGTQQNQFRGQGRLIGVIDAGKPFEFAGSCFFVKALWVPIFAGFYWGVDEYFYEISGLESPPDTIPVDSVRVNKCGKSDDVLETT